MYAFKSKKTNCDIALRNDNQMFMFELACAGLHLLLAVVLRVLQS